MQDVIVGVIVLLLFYLLILAVGVIAAWKFKAKPGTSKTEMSVVAGRNISTTVGVFTMTATLVGGGYVNGTAESIATQGLMWTLAPFGIFLGLVLGGLFFAKPMREKRYLTMMDPFQQRYGDTVTALLYLTSFVGDVCWSASILSALGTSLSVIIELDVTVSIVVSSLIAVIYTTVGQMVAVAYTDIVQLVLIVLGLAIVTPFAMTNENAGDITAKATDWLGEPIAPKQIAAWVDLFIAMILGSIPWQSYFQRVLSVRGARQAQVLSVVGGLSALIMMVPPMLIGAVAVSADWNSTELGQSPADRQEAHMTLPYVLKYFTPKAVSILGLGAITAAVMSSTDSAILGSSSMFTHNVYSKVFRKKATEEELQWVQRVAIVIVGTIATVIALFFSTVYFLFILAADLVFVVLMPQLICILYVPFSNAYGALVGYFMALLLRFGAGESTLNISPFIEYPGYTSQDGQLFPYRVVTFIISMVVIVAVSLLTNWMMKTSEACRSCDFLRQCCSNHGNSWQIEDDKATKGDIYEANF